VKAIQKIIYAGFAAVALLAASMPVFSEAADHAPPAIFRR
jgi:hypothetical protein